MPPEESPSRVAERVIPEGDECETEGVRRVEGEVLEPPVSFHEEITKPAIVPRKKRKDEIDKMTEIEADVLVADAECLEAVEEEGESSGGREECEGLQDTVEQQQSEEHDALTDTLNKLTGRQLREELAKLTNSDKSLEVARKLAREGKNGYSWQKGLLFKHRLDDLGRNYKQLCLPQEYRARCMSLAYERFGHRGKHKCAEDIMQYFYWPTLWRDVSHHCRSCGVCQRVSKVAPRQVPMKEREVLDVPSERVALDIVGPFPKA